MLYLYHTYVYHDTENVLGVDPTEETSNSADFENNYKSQCVEVDDIVPGETMFDINVDYDTFKGYITSPFDWGDVKYANEEKAYDLYLLVSEPL